MRIPLKIYITDFDSANSGDEWQDITDNWEDYNNQWQQANAGLLTPILDMYNDEDITIKSIIKDLSDPKKLFTDYSQSFTIPASKKNNRIFKHYYNIDVINGLDTRLLIPCRLLLNNEVYKVGNLNIESVSMSNGVAESYKIRFIGKLSELARRIGEDELTNLDFSGYDIDGFVAKDEFSSSTTGNIVFPLASRSNRYLYNSTTADINIENATNIGYAGVTPADNYGVDENQLVGAIRVGAILEQIQEAYGLDFQGVFQENYIQELYFWLHKAKKKEEGEVSRGIMRNIAVTDASGNLPIYGWSNEGTSFQFAATQDSSSRYAVRFRPTFVGDAKVSILSNGEILQEVNNSNEWTDEVYFRFNPATITFIAETALASTINMEIYVEYQQYDEYYVGQEWRSQGDRYYGGSISTGGSDFYNVSENLPQMKVMDFLGSLFKQFNIVAEVDENLTVTTRHYDVFMYDGKVKDISRFVDRSQYEVSKPNLYNSIKFEYADPKTALEQGFLQVNGKQYGELSYQLTGDGGFKFSGSEYKVKLENQRIPIEPLKDLHDSTDTNVIYTLFADLKGAEQSIKPMFTYIVKRSGATGTQRVAWTSGGAVDAISNYIMPCNHYTKDQLEPNSDNALLGLYFGEELNEYNADQSLIGVGLWNSFYRGTTAMMFDENKRSVQFKAMLPAGEVKNLNLADTLVISNSYYRINAIETNYYTGETKLDLTLVGLHQMNQFRNTIIRYRNDSSTEDLRIVFMDINGFLNDITIAPSTTSFVLSLGDPMAVVGEYTILQYIYD